MTEIHQDLRDDVRMLGACLGKAITNHLGEDFLQKIEQIRQLAKEGRNNDGAATDDKLLAALATLSDDDVLPVARSFTQFLNLANIAEEYHRIHRLDLPDSESREAFPQLLKQLRSQGIEEDHIMAALGKMNVELVLTAHPTEINRRTLIQKYNAITECLRERGEQDSNDRLDQLISQIWHTNEIRQNRPTPVDEAKWGFAVIENSLWKAMPQFLRELDEETQTSLGRPPLLQRINGGSKWKKWRKRALKNTARSCVKTPNSCLIFALAHRNWNWRNCRWDQDPPNATPTVA